MSQWTYQTSSKVVEQGKCVKCTSSDAYTLYEDGHTHCFSCGWHTPPEISLELIKQRLETKTKGVYDINLPADYCPTLPPEATKWFNKYALTVAEKSLNRIGWSDKRESMIFPIYQRGELLLYQSRYFGSDERKPKWTTHGIKDFLYCIGNISEPEFNGTVVLVEDLISAIKVGRVATASCLFGSSISGELIHRISKNYDKVVVWLDADKRLEAIKTSLQLSEAGLRASTVFTDEDPKCFTTSDIRMMLRQKEQLC